MVTGEGKDTFCCGITHWQGTLALVNNSSSRFLEETLIKCNELHTHTEKKTAGQRKRVSESRRRKKRAGRVN